MKTVTSVSGGQSSAYIAVNYPTDFNVFSLVCIDEPKAAPKDKKIIQMVSDRIGREFIATAEDDIILNTILDLEQYIGSKIDWVAGDSFDQVINKKGGFLPNQFRRFCTVEMKLRPMFRWWKNNCLIQENEPIEMHIGFRANEHRRAKSMLENCNDDGLIQFKDVVGKHSNGKNKWAEAAWQKPRFPMIEDGILKHHVQNYWSDKPVRFAPINGCVGCIHKQPLLLRLEYDNHPETMNWFEKIEKDGKGTWKDGMTYADIKKHKPQMQLGFEDFSDCDSGHCGL